MDTVITNNPLVRAGVMACDFVPEDTLAVLRQARDMIHQGYQLAVHPLAGNIRPERLRYKTLVLTGPEDRLDLRSLELIEMAIAAAGRQPKVSEQGSGGMEADLQLIDADILYNARPDIFVNGRPRQMGGAAERKATGWQQSNHLGG
ncbi:MAG: GrdX family protein [bacterium]|jgi:hypothetical protein